MNVISNELDAATTLCPATRSHRQLTKENRRSTGRTFSFTTILYIKTASSLGVVVPNGIFNCAMENFEWLLLYFIKFILFTAVWQPINRYQCYIIYSILLDKKKITYLIFYMKSVVSWGTLSYYWIRNLVCECFQGSISICHYSIIKLCYFHSAGIFTRMFVKSSRRSTGATLSLPRLLDF